MENWSALWNMPNYRGLKISIRGGRNVTIQGSLHKAFNNGINHNDFYYEDFLNAIQIITNELVVDVEDLIIQRIEFGVNIYNSKLPFSTIENNLLLHRLNPFMTYLKGNIVMGFYCKRQRYELKIYDKSI